MFGSGFLDNGLNDSENVYRFENCDSRASSLLVNSLDIFAPLLRKWGSSWPAVVYALHKWLIMMFSETPNASNFKI